MTERKCKRETEQRSYLGKRTERKRLQHRAMSERERGLNRGGKVLLTENGDGVMVIDEGGRE